MWAKTMRAANGKILMGAKVVGNEKMVLAQMMGATNG
jgi:hypothetical protein